ncbi:MAG: HPr family phosphocarrier protein [Oscillibacter sp.]|nr:HPr family phosphocarrier protein [Oscillibacter sp.]
MLEFKCVINDELGIHARPAGQLAKEAKNFGETTISVTKGDKTVKASQLMKLMGLGVKKGDEVTVSAEGGDEAAAIDAMKAFFKNNFAAEI